MLICHVLRESLLITCGAERHVSPHKVVTSVKNEPSINLAIGPREFNHIPCVLPLGHWGPNLDGVGEAMIVAELNAFKR
jgi:hypothetical protein